MVGRLVEQQDVGRRCQHARQRGAARFAAGEIGGIFLAGEAELIQQIAGGMGVVARPEAGFDIGERDREAGKVRLLRQIADNGARAGRTPSRCPVRPGRPRFRAASICPSRCGRPAQTRSPGRTDSSAPDRSGVPPKVSAMSLS